MNHQDPNASPNILEQINQVCREFGKQISKSKSPRIENYLSKVPEEGQENLFSNLLGMEVNYRHRKGEEPTTKEYLKRFPEFKKQVRRAFFEPSMGSVDEDVSTDVDGHTESFRNPEQHANAFALTHELPDANRLGDYELIRELGRGGFGVVYEARHTKSGNRVALKTLPTGGDGQQVNADRLYRFRREFRTLSEINHPNLVGMQSLEVDGSQWFFTMDLIDGEDFLSYVRPDGKLDESRLRHCLSQLAEGVISLHRRGIIHRDLKPSNVLVEPDGRVLILDFGLVAQLQTNTELTVSRSGMFAGTPRYAAPEQMFGQRSEASDWYAFGTMLYESLTGQPPFTGKQMELLRQKQNEDPPSLVEQEQTEIAEDLAALTDGLLKREPKQRFNTSQIVTALQLELETRTHGSTAGSPGSSGSVDEEQLDWQATDKDIVLIGREEQLQQLEAARQELLQTRQPVVVWITGKSGEGKSSLAEKFLRPIRLGTEMLVMSGRCYDRESVPFKVIDSQIDALVRFLRSHPEDEVEKRLPPDIEMLARLFPLLRRVEPIKRRGFGETSGLDERQIRNLAFAALRDLLAAIGQTTPVVMFVDDLQWGDADSAGVFGKLLSPPDPPPVMFVGSFRSDEVADIPFLHQWGEQVDGTDAGTIAARQIHVEPLTEQECLDYVRYRFGDEGGFAEQQITQLFDSSKGNPYFLEQLVEGYDAKRGQFQPVPLEQIIERRLDRCPADARDLLAAVAVGGKAVSAAEVSAISGQPSTAVSTLTHMRSERLVRLLGSQEELLVDTYHDKIRETALDGMPDADRKSLHLRYAETIESERKPTQCVEGTEAVASLDEHVFDLAYHFLEADDSRAFDYQLQAAQASVNAFAIEQAMEYLQRAEALQPSDIDRQSRFQLQFLQGKAMSATGEMSKSADRYARALKLADTKSRRADVKAALGEVYYKQGKRREGLALLRDALAELGERVPRTLPGKVLGILWNIIHIHPVSRITRSREVDEQRDQEVRQTIRIYGLFTILVTMLDGIGMAYAATRSCSMARLCSGKVEKATGLSIYACLFSFSGLNFIAERLLKNLRSLVDIETESSQLAGTMLHSLGMFHYMAGRIDESRRTLLAAEEILAKSDSYLQGSVLHFYRHLWSARGDANQIRYFGHRELEFGRRNGDPMKMAEGQFALVDALSRSGDTEQAIALGHETIEMLEPMGFYWISIPTHELGRAYLQAGDYENAVTYLKRASWRVVKGRLFEITAYVFPLYVEALLGPHWQDRSLPINRGHLRRARFYCRVTRSCSVLFPNIRPQALRMAGRIMVMRGKSKKAFRFFDRSIAVAETIGIDYEHARALIDKSLLDYPEAGEDRERGLALLKSLGCVLPDAEVEYLGIDREAHHAHAAATRDAENSRGEKNGITVNAEAES